jgi:large subunit ribosomal protein L21
MYAIVKAGGKQYRVEKGDSLLVDRMSEDEGAKVTLEPLLIAGDDKDPVFGGADLGKVKVEAVVTGHERGPKIRVLKYKAKKGYRKRSGHRSELTRLEIGDIKLGARKAPAKKEESESPDASRQEKKPAAEAKAPAKKPAAKKPAAKKPAAKKEKTDGS